MSYEGKNFVPMIRIPIVKGSKALRYIDGFVYAYTLPVVKDFVIEMMNSINSVIPDKNFQLHWIDGYALGLGNWFVPQIYMTCSKKDFKKYKSALDKYFPSITSFRLFKDVLGWQVEKDWTRKIQPAGAKDKTKKRVIIDTHTNLPRLHLYLTEENSPEFQRELKFYKLLKDKGNMEWHRKYGSFLSENTGTPHDKFLEKRHRLMNDLFKAVAAKNPN
jgi:hypothetical protein